MAKYQPIRYSRGAAKNRGKPIKPQLVWEQNHIEGFPYSISFTPADRLVKVTGDGGNWSYTLFDVDYNEASGGTPIITYEFTIYGIMGGEENTYYHFPGGHAEGLANDALSPIAEDEFNAIRISHGLDNLIWWGAMPDQTELILAMP